MKSKKKVIIVAVLVLLGLYLFTEIINNFSTKTTGATYNKYCAGCHGKDGKGLEKLIPPLANADWLNENSERLPCVILKGIHEPITVNGIDYHQEMIGIEDYINNVELHNLVNYVYNSWGNDIGYVSIDSIEKMKEKCK